MIFTRRDSVETVPVPAAIPPPDNALVERIEKLFEQAATHFSSTAHPLFGSKRSTRVVMEPVWDIFPGYPQDLTNWKRAKLKRGYPGGQHSKTKKLISIFNGSGQNAGAIRSCSIDSYVALLDYWRQDPSTLAKVISALESYEAIVRTLVVTNTTSRYEARRRASRLTRAVKHGKTDLEADALVSLPAPAMELESKGDSTAARQWLIANWASCKSWENRLHYIRLAEKAGAGADDLDEFQRLRRSLHGQPDQVWEIAERYFVGRVLSQMGDMNSAQQMHLHNVPISGHSSYQLSSQFEVAQIEFRVENFAQSRNLFLDLHHTLGAVPGSPVQLRVNVLKFLATFEHMHVLFDVPCCEVALHDVIPGRAQTCLEYAEEAIRLSSDDNYVDGLGWAYVVRAFAHEGLGDFKKSEADYGEAAKYHSNPQAHGNSVVYTLFYNAGMLRRQRKLPFAEKLLLKCERLMGDRPRPSFVAELLTQRGLIAAAHGNNVAAANYHRAAIRILARDPAVRARHDWRSVTRMRKVCDSLLGCHLEDLFNESKPYAGDR